MALKHPGKTKAQQRALDAIGCGEHSPIMAKATIKKLLDDGLIYECRAVIVGNGPFRVRIRQFDMTPATHIAWCEYQSAQAEAPTPKETGNE